MKPPRDDSFIDNLRRAGLLLEFSAAEWADYACKYFGTEPLSASPFVSPPPTDPKDLGFKDPHRTQPYGAEYPNEQDDYDL